VQRDSPFSADNVVSESALPPRLEMSVPLPYWLAGHIARALTCARELNQPDIERRMDVRNAKKRPYLNDDEIDAIFEEIRTVACDLRSSSSRA
jgi:hypothetical protein